jgi:hypothetical protein
MIQVKKNVFKEKEIEKQERQRIKKQIELEKLKRKYLEPKKIEIPKKAKPIQPITQAIPGMTRSIISKHPKQEPAPRQIQKPTPTPPKQTPLKQTPTLQTRPMPRIPQTLGEPTSELNVGKIKELIDNPSVQVIECQGTKKKIIIKKNNQTMKSDITLNKKEINEIINEFSDKARIPLIEGMLRARVGSLHISAIVSKIASSKFIITRTQAPRIPSLQFQRPPTRLQRPPFPQQTRPMQPQQPQQLPEKPSQPPTNPTVPEGYQQSSIPPIKRPFLQK